jgi:hypothetical protein
MSLNQSSAIHIQASYSAEARLTGWAGNFAGQHF